MDFKQTAISRGMSVPSIVCSQRFTSEQFLPKTRGVQFVRAISRMDANSLMKQLGNDQSSAQTPLQLLEQNQGRLAVAVIALDRAMVLEAVGFIQRDCAVVGFPHLEFDPIDVALEDGDCAFEQ